MYVKLQYKRCLLSNSIKLSISSSESISNLFHFRANAFAERLRLGIAVIHGDIEMIDDSDRCDGRQSPPPAARSRNTSECFTLTAPVLPMLGKIFFHN